MSEDGSRWYKELKNSFAGNTEILNWLSEVKNEIVASSGILSEGQLRSSSKTDLSYDDEVLYRSII